MSNPRVLDSGAEGIEKQAVEVLVPVQGGNEVIDPGVTLANMGLVGVHVTLTDSPREGETGN